MSIELFRQAMTRLAADMGVEASSAFLEAGGVMVDESLVRVAYLDDLAAIHVLVDVGEVPVQDEPEFWQLLLQLNAGRHEVPHPVWALHHEGLAERVVVSFLLPAALAGAMPLSEVLLREVPALQALWFRLLDEWELEPEAEAAL